VSYWVDQHHHYGTTVTSWIEGAHSVIKRFLESSTSDLLTVFYSIEIVVDNQMHRIHTKAASLCIVNPIDVSHHIYSKLKGRVTIPAI
jgi:hypothetical protein